MTKPPQAPTSEVRLVAIRSSEVNPEDGVIEIDVLRWDSGITEEEALAAAAGTLHEQDAWLALDRYRGKVREAFDVVPDPVNESV